jgi:hypothetical protein
MLHDAALASLVHQQRLLLHLPAAGAAPAVFGRAVQPFAGRLLHQLARLPCAAAPLLLRCLPLSAGLQRTD